MKFVLLLVRIGVEDVAILISVAKNARRKDGQNINLFVRSQEVVLYLTLMIRRVVRNFVVM